MPEPREAGVRRRGVDVVTRECSVVPSVPSGGSVYC